MPTVRELNQQVEKAKFEMTLIDYLVLHLDTEFLPSADKVAPKTLLTEDTNKPVPQEIFEQVAQLLLDRKTALSTFVASVLDLPIQGGSSDAK